MNKSEVIFKGDNVLHMSYAVLGNVTIPLTLYGAVNGIPFRYNVKHNCAPAVGIIGWDFDKRVMRNESLTKKRNPPLTSWMGRFKYWYRMHIAYKQLKHLRAKAETNGRETLDNLIKLLVKHYANGPVHLTRNKDITIKPLDLMKSAIFIDFIIDETRNTLEDLKELNDLYVAQTHVLRTHSKKLNYTKSTVEKLLEIRKAFDDTNCAELISPSVLKDII